MKVDGVGVKVDGVRVKVDGVGVKVDGVGRCSWRSCLGTHLRY